MIVKVNETILFAFVRGVMRWKNLPNWLHWVKFYSSRDTRPVDTWDTIRIEHKNQSLPIQGVGRNCIQPGPELSGKTYVQATSQGTAFMNLSCPSPGKDGEMRGVLIVTSF